MWMQPSLFWASRLGIARWKMAISAFFFLSHPPFLLWKFVLTHSSHFLFCKDVTLPCTRGLFATAKLKRHCSIKPVNAVSSRPRKTIKVFPSHSALAVSWQHFAPKKKKHTHTQLNNNKNKKKVFVYLPLLLSMCQDSVFGLALTLELTFLSSTAVNKTLE